MKWVLLHKAGEAPVKTQVCSLMELYRGEPLILGVRKLEISPADEAGFPPLAIVVSLKDREDYLFASSDGSVERTVEGGFVFAGRFGYFSQKEKRGKPAGSLVGGNRLTRNGVGLKSRRPGRIPRADRGPGPSAKPDHHFSGPANPESLTGKIIYVTNPYAPGGAEGGIDATAPRADSNWISPRTAASASAGSRASRPQHPDRYPVLSGRLPLLSRRPPDQRGGSAEYFTADVVNRKYAQIDPAAHPTIDPAKLAAEFPVGSWFEIYDYGVGDEVVWPAVLEANWPRRNWPSRTFGRQTPVVASDGSSATFHMGGGCPRSSIPR